MTPRVWVERPITSVEDAEGLPVGTVAVCGVFNPLVKWEAEDGTGGWSDLEPGDDGLLVGFTALVPVEAEEERRPAWHMAGTEHVHPATRRLRTPWEVAE